MLPHLHVSDKPCGKTDRVTRAWRPREKRDKRDRHVNCVTERLSDYMKYTLSYREQINDLIKIFL